ncbi:MAG: hypothetical protein WCG95_08085 [bacterium]
MRITGKLFTQKNQGLLKKAIAQKTQRAVDVKNPYRRNVLNKELQWLNAKDKAIGRARNSNTARANRQFERGPLTNHALNDTISWLNLGRASALKSSKE